VKPRAGLLALVLATAGACGGQPAGPHGDPGVCASALGAAKPVAHIGPDANLRVLCGQPARAAVASVDVPGAGLTWWSLSLEGDQGYAADPLTFVTCAAASPRVAFVSFVPPMDAVPGDAFDARVTVRSSDGAFATDTVQVHAEVAAPTVTVDTTMIDFGDVALGSLSLLDVALQVESQVSVVAPSDEAPFSFLSYSTSDRVGPRVFKFHVVAAASTPGDYSLRSEWRAGYQPDGTFPAPCDWHLTIPIHMHVLDDVDGGSDAGPNAPEDGPQAAPPDGGA
jgi:hypothetical protein